NNVVGILSEKDIMNYMFSGNLSAAVISEAMTKNVVSMTSETDLDKVALLKFRCSNNIKSDIITRPDNFIASPL
ncbi:MAG: hypothetical protein CVV49_21430, partial [Spirochaetae bacterium HGW-Spirochaetae-5]